MPISHRPTSRVPAFFQPSVALFLFALTWGAARGLTSFGGCAAAAAGASLCFAPYATGLDPAVRVYPAIVRTLAIWTVAHALGCVLLTFLWFGSLRRRQRFLRWALRGCWRIARVAGRSASRRSPPSPNPSRSGSGMRRRCTMRREPAFPSRFWSRARFFWPDSSSERRRSARPLGDARRRADQRCVSGDRRPAEGLSLRDAQGLCDGRGPKRLHAADGRARTSARGSSNSAGALPRRGCRRRSFPPAKAATAARRARNALYPALADQPAWYLSTHLRLWKEGKRGGTPAAHLMNGIAIHMTDEQIEAVALRYADASVER